jgi:hypothetical protein
MKHDEPIGRRAESLSAVRSAPGADRDPGSREDDSSEDCGNAAAEDNANHRQNVMHRFGSRSEVPTQITEKTE